MTSTYRVMQIAASGTLELVERVTPQPAPGEVLIAVEACGVCGADLADIARADPALRRVPGHEVIGRIVALGEGVAPVWRVGQRVGVGRLGGPCHHCTPCRQGRFQHCEKQPVTGATRDGGYAEMMLARASGLVAIPEMWNAREAAPVLCAGLATFRALATCGAQPGDLVAVLGIGGLGHMAVQYAQAMGFEVAAIGRGADLAGPVHDLGAHHYLDIDREDAVACLAAWGGAQAIIATIGHAPTVSGLMGALAPGGRMVLLGVGPEQVPVSPGALVAGERALVGSITGTPHDAERALHFSLLAGARPWIETLPLERAAEALERMASGKAMFRMVLTMEQPSCA